MFDNQQGQLLFTRFATPNIGYSEFCNMIVPCDSISSAKLLARVVPYDNVGFESLELMRRLMRAHLSLA